MGAFDWLVGSGGGIDKNISNLLLNEATEEYGGRTGLFGLGKRRRRMKDPYAVDPRFTDYVNRTVEPGFARARQSVNAEYANADAPIVSGGRTQALLGLAGEEAGVKGQMTMEEVQRKRALYQRILELLAQPKAPTQGLLGAAAPIAGYALGGGFSKPKPSNPGYI